VELEQSIARFKAEGMNVAAVSYDTQEILDHFSKRVGGISYPLLADPDAKMIRAFGVLNRNIEAESADYGMARPGTFVLDERGVVKSKYFEPGHRQRTTAESLLIKELGVGGGTRTEVTTPHLKLTAYPAQDVARRGNRLTLVFEIELSEKMHLYAPGVEGYRPVVVQVAEAPYLRIHETTFPESEMISLPVINETVPVFRGKTRILQDVTLSPRLPGFDENAGRDLAIPVTFAYQACNDKVCFAPTEVPLTFKLEIAELDEIRVPEAMQREGTED
jgi:hypothetical protein